jgi:hypothetical protein
MGLITDWAMSSWNAARDGGNDTLSAMGVVTFTASARPRLASQRRLHVPHGWEELLDLLEDLVPHGDAADVRGRVVGAKITNLT